MHDIRELFADEVNAKRKAQSDLSDTRASLDKIRNAMVQAAKQRNIKIPEGMTLLALLDRLLDRPQVDSGRDHSEAKDAAREAARNKQAVAAARRKPIASD